jgi:hypothetical protein
MKKIRLTESELVALIEKVIKENGDVPMGGEQKENKKKEPPKPRCIPENMIPLDEMVGQADEYVKYSPGVAKRRMGVNSMVDTLGILNNIRLFKDVKDGGAHLAYDMMHNLNRFRNKNYHDETTGECHKAMDKIIELYKENEHGTELVKDIERVLALQTKDDEYTPSPRAKEYLKQCINLIKGQ